MPVIRVRTASDARDRFFGLVLLLIVLGAGALWLLASIDAGVARGASHGHFVLSVATSAIVIVMLGAAVLGVIWRAGCAASGCFKERAQSDEDGR